MESVGKTMSQMNRSQQFNYEELVAQILTEPEIAALLKRKPYRMQKSVAAFQNLINTSVSVIALSLAMQIILQEGISLF